MKKTEMKFTKGFLHFIVNSNLTGKGSYSLDQLWDKYIFKVSENLLIDHELQNYALAHPNYKIRSIEIDCEISFTRTQATNLVRQQKAFLADLGFPSENLHSMYINNEGKKSLKIYTL